MDLLLNNYMRSEGHGDTWAVEILPPSRPVKSYYEETVIAAEMIWAQKVGKLQLCLSGGLDSEYVLAVLLKLGMEVEPVIMTTAYNHHETQYAFKFCQEHNITPTVVDLDYDKFISSDEYLEIAESMCCGDWRIPCNMWLAKQLDGTVITGNDPPHMKLNSEDAKWYLDEEEIIHSQFNFWRKNKLHGTPFLLSYTPEQMLSFLIDSTIERLANHGFPGKLGTNSSKVHVFNNGTGFNLIQRTKQNGYEIAEQHPIYNHPNIQLVKSWEAKWKGTSDHQYHEVVSLLRSGQSSKAFAACPANG
jgi:hypothetical protein